MPIWVVGAARCCRPKVDLLLFGVVVEVPVEEVQLLAPLAAGKPAPPNTLPRPQLTQIAVSAGALPALVPLPYDRLTCCRI